MFSGQIKTGHFVPKHWKRYCLGLGVLRVEKQESGRSERRPTGTSESNAKAKPTEAGQLVSGPPQTVVLLSGPPLDSLVPFFWGRRQLFRDHLLFLSNTVIHTTILAFLLKLTTPLGGFFFVVCFDQAALFSPSITGLCAVHIWSLVCASSCHWELVRFNYHCEATSSGSIASSECLDSISSNRRCILTEIPRCLKSWNPKSSELSLSKTVFCLPLLLPSGCGGMTWSSVASSPLASVWHAIAHQASVSCSFSFT